MTPLERVAAFALIVVVVLAAATYLVAVAFVAARQYRIHKRREAYDDAVNDRLMGGDDSPRNRNRR